MEVPRGFIRCDECEGHGVCLQSHEPPALEEHPNDWNCHVCSGSGLVPTEELREEMAGVLWESWWGDKREPWQVALSKRSSDVLEMYREQANAVLRKVAEHIREER